MNGNAHTKASLILTGGFLLGSVFTQDIHSLLYAVGSLAGVIVQPDCDVDKGFVGDKYIRQRAGRAAEVFWRAIWYFYRRSLKHGMELSHFYGIGTLGRILYLYFFLIVLPHAIFYFTLKPSWDLWYVLSWYWERIDYRFVLGLMGADAIHYTLDLLTTNNKFLLWTGGRGFRMWKQRVMSGDFRTLRKIFL